MVLEKIYSHQISPTRCIAEVKAYTDDFLHVGEGNQQIIWFKDPAGNTIADRIWLASFMDYDLGFFDQDRPGWRSRRVEPLGENPFAPKVLPMFSAAGAPV